MKEEYVEGLIEIPRINEESLPEQLKGLLGQFICQNIKLLRNMLTLAVEECFFGLLSGLGNRIGPNIGRDPIVYRVVKKPFYDFLKVTLLFYM